LGLDFFNISFNLAPGCSKTTGFFVLSDKSGIPNQNHISDSSTENKKEKARAPACRGVPENIKIKKHPQSF